MNYLVINCSPVRDGATAAICRMAAEYLGKKGEVRSVCIDDYSIAYCKGCRVCHTTAVCVQSDGADKLMEQYEWADMIVSVSPSYWADVPGQFKAFIDRCTPWCDTHEPHASLSGGKTGCSVVLRTGPGVRECERIAETLEHFCGHLGIESRGRLMLCSVENRMDAEARREEIEEFFNGI